MTTTELATAIGEKPKAVLDAVKRGMLKAVKVEEKLSPVGYRWNVTTPLEEARAIMAKRVRRASPSVPRRGSLRVATAKMTAELPASRDLFRPEEAVKYIGISKGKLYTWLREQKIETLRNGRSSYIPRSVVEKARETFRPKSPVVEAPRVQAQAGASAEQLAQLEKMFKMFNELLHAWNRTDLFLRGFAKSCGYSE